MDSIDPGRGPGPSKSFSRSGHALNLDHLLLQDLPGQRVPAGSEPLLQIGCDWPPKGHPGLQALRQVPVLVPEEVDPPGDMADAA